MHVTHAVNPDPLDKLRRDRSRGGCQHPSEHSVLIHTEEPEALRDMRGEPADTPNSAEQDPAVAASTGRM